MFELITPFYIKITNARAFEAIFAFFSANKHYLSYIQ